MKKNPPSSESTPSSTTSSSEVQPIIQDVTVADNLPTALASSGSGYQPPQDLGHAPAVPPGVVFLTGPQRRAKKHLTRDQVAALPGLIAELTASGSYPVDFGAHAPGIQVIVRLAKGTVAVDKELKPARAWARYVGDQRLLSGDALLVQLEVLSGLFAAAVLANPGLANTYPVLATFVESRSVIGKKGAATRKANKAEQAKAEKAAPATPAASTPATGSGNAHG